MNQTLPRCLQCGENPRMVIGRSEFAVDYHPLCQECHWILWEKSQREARGEMAPENKQSFVPRSRHLWLMLTICSGVQLPMILLLKGPLVAVVIHSVLVSIAAPCAVIGFWLNRRKA